MGRGYEFSYITNTIRIKSKREKIHLVKRMRIIKRLDKMSAGRNIQTDHLNIQLQTSELNTGTVEKVFKKWADQKRKRIITKNQFKSPTGLHKYHNKQTKNNLERFLWESFQFIILVLKAGNSPSSSDQRLPIEIMRINWEGRWSTGQKPGWVRRGERQRWGERQADTWVNQAAERD